MSNTPILDPIEAYSMWAPHYPARAHNPVMQAEERAMLELMPVNLQGCSVLDAGCGSGRYMLHAIRHGAARVTGVDASAAMLDRATVELTDPQSTAVIELVQGSLTTLPMPDAWADLTICALVLGHVEQLEGALAELRRATRPGGVLLCSDVHPIGHALGWLRDFKSDGQRYAVRHTAHLYSQWHATCASLGLAIEQVLEPMLDPADIPLGARFDLAALKVPVAIVFQLRRIP
jgi:malonyl-CoA O-methyltransferase